MSTSLNYHTIDGKSLMNNFSGSKSFGPLTINYDLNTSIPQITVKATLFGISVGSGVINPSNPSITLGGHIGNSKATITLTVDFNRKELDYDVSINLGGISSNWKGTLFTW